MKKTVHTALMLSLLILTPSLYASTADISDADFEAFAAQFNLKQTTTEHHHPITQDLSTVFHENPVQGLDLLHQVDQDVAQGLQVFSDQYRTSLTKSIEQSLKKGGRLIMVGSGSSGRIAIDLAAKWRAYWISFYTDRVIGLISGGPRAIVKAKEAYEDSIDAGRDALSALSPTENDTVVLISASGSASFNIGFGQVAREHRAETYYFYNSKIVPERTQNLFDDHGVQQLLVETGPQAISGSTRLQAATLAELCLGHTLNTAIKNLRHIGYEPNTIKDQARAVNRLIQENLEDISKIVALGIKVFSGDQANFNRPKDETDCGYVTYLADGNSIRETLIDATETAPTFSTNPPRSIDEVDKKKAEFRAYLLEKEDNLAAWKTLSGFKDLTAEDQEDVLKICVGEGAQGFGSFLDRPTSKGNLIILALKSKPNVSQLAKLKEAKDTGASTALLYLSAKGDTLPYDKTAFIDAVVHLPLAQNDCSDPLGVLQTIALKQTLNLISNGMMLGMNKVVGNRMIDLGLSNKKLIYRAINILKDLLRKANFSRGTISDQDLYNKLITARDYRQDQEKNHNRSVPTPVKIVYTQLKQNVDLSEAVEILQQNGENLGVL